jgi:predicted Zn finger-like uncharacterized protein
MIIVCPECSTKYNVSSDRIPEGGIKVRCARCQHVFPVEKIVELSPVATTGENPVHEVPETPLYSETSIDQPIDDSDFSYDKFQELDTRAPESETFTFGAEAEIESENFTFAESTEDPDTVAQENFEGKNEATPPAEVVITEEIIVESAMAVEPTATPDTPSQQIQKNKVSPLSSIIKFLLLLIFAILIVGGVFVYINGPDQLNQTFQQIFGQQTTRPVQTGQITLSGLEGKFIKNEHSGDLFLIHGEAINNYSQPRAAIQVKGVIFDPNGKPLLQKTVFCGNPISMGELQTLSFVELEKIMGNQFGKNLSNMKIDSKKSIPFDIVFKDLPQNLSEFSVKVTSSEAVTK